MTDQQLREDLEALYESLQHGWTRKGEARKQFGEREGCLVNHISIIVSNQKLADRPGAMVRALGFPTFSAMYTWNDHPQRTWDEVKERVKDAIGKL